MTLFDLIVVIVIGVSALLGFSRGAVRELVGLLAFAVSAAAALILLPFTGAIASKLISAGIFSTALAVIGGFAVVYLAFKLLGHLLATHLHQQTVLGGADRSLGLGIGAARAFVLLGLFALVFDHATPDELKPRWITGAFLYPLTSASGRLLSGFAPKGMDAFSRISPFLKSAAGAGDAAPPGEEDTGPNSSPRPPTNHLAISGAKAQKGAVKGKGYGKHARDSVDALVEKTR